MAISDGGRVIPFFQPILEIDTCRVYGFEVLGRKETTQGIESLGGFFHDPSLPEDMKLAIDRLIRRQALKIFREYQEDFYLFLNIQPQWLLTAHEEKRSLSTLLYLEEFHIDPGRIVIEISETEFEAHPHLLPSLVNQYRAVGCKVAIDDVGRGFNNFERLITLEPDFIKVDLHPVNMFDYCETFQYLLEGFGGFAQRAGINLVLEGVENPSLFQLGLHAGFRYYQGFLIGYPQPTPQYHLPSLLTQREMEVYWQKENTKYLNQYAFIHALKKMVETLSPPTTIQTLVENIQSLLPKLPSQCFRVYGCNREGYQVTPNFVRVQEGSWTSLPQYVGRNWSWRPYFFPNTFLSLYFESGIASEVYIDLETRRKVWTTCFSLHNEFLLFFDLVAQNEESLPSRLTPPRD